MNALHWVRKVLIPLSITRSLFARDTEIEASEVTVELSADPQARILPIPINRINDSDQDCACE